MLFAVDWKKETKNTQTAGHTQAWAGKQTVFVSHSWSTPFENLVLTIEEFEATHIDDTTNYYYIDVFCLNQHDLAEVQEAKASGIADDQDVGAVLLKTLQ